MNKNNIGGWIFILAILAGLYWVFEPTIKRVLTPKIEIPALPTITIINPLGTATPVADAQAAAAAERGNPIPTQEFAYIKANDLAGLQSYLDNQSQNWSSVSTNVWTMDISGVAPWSLTNSSLGGTRSITWTAVWKGQATGGLTAAFSVPKISLDEEGWVEVTRTQSITQSNLVLVEYQTTAKVAFTGQTCVASVQHWDFSPIHYGEYIQTDNSAPRAPDGEEWSFLLDPANHNSYSLWSEETTTGWFPPEAVSLNDHLYTEQMAMASAKVIAHENEKMVELLEFVEASVQPGGSFYNNQVLPNFSPEVASLYRVRGFEIVINLTPLVDELGRILRCKGTPVIQ